MVNLALGTHIHTRFVGGVIECHKLNQAKAKMPQAHLNFMVKFWQKKKTFRFFAKILLRIRFSKGCLMCGAIFAD